jgi:hypothetical protein
MYIYYTYINVYTYICVCINVTFWVRTDQDISIPLGQVIILGWKCLTVLNALPYNSAVICSSAKVL